MHEFVETSWGTIYRIRRHLKFSSDLVQVITYFDKKKKQTIISRLHNLKCAFENTHQAKILSSAFPACLPCHSESWIQCKQTWVRMPGVCMNVNSFSVVSCIRLLPFVYWFQCWIMRRITWLQPLSLFGCKLWTNKGAFETFWSIQSPLWAEAYYLGQFKGHYCHCWQSHKNVNCYPIWLK